MLDYICTDSVKDSAAMMVDSVVELLCSVTSILGVILYLLQLVQNKTWLFVYFTQPVCVFTFLLFHQLFKSFVPRNFQQDVY